MQPQPIAIISFLFSFLSCQAFEFPDGQIQPGCYPPPALPRNFSTKPQHWRSAALWHGEISRIGPRQTAKMWPGWSGIEHVFSFGDSYTSTGFSIQGPQPDKSNPLGNPAYPGFTSSDGPNYVDFLTTTYNRSYIQTYNHAFGGATVDPTLVPSPFGPIVQSFKQQVEHGFLPNYASRDTVPWSSSKSLFTVFFGINDVVLSYEQKNDTLNYTIIKSYENLVHKLYLAGARNFLIINVPPIDRAPRLEKSRPGLAGYIGRFNFRLYYLAQNLATNFPDTTVFQFDANWFFSLAMKNAKYFPETSGFRNTTGYCEAYKSGTPILNYLDPSCSFPVSEYLWLNDLHPTYPMHNLMAARIVALFGS